MRKMYLVARREYLENVKTKGFWFGIFLMPVILCLSIMVPVLLESARSAKTYAVIDQSGWLLAEIDREILAGDLNAVLFMEQLTAQQQNPSHLPESLAGISQSLADLNPEALMAVARELAMGEGSQAAGISAAQGQDLVQWWSSLDARQSRNLVPGSSRDRFERVVTDTRDREQLNRMVVDEEIFAYLVIGKDPVTDDVGSKFVSVNLTDKSLRDWFSGLAGEQVRKRRLAQEQIDDQIAAWIQAPLTFESRIVSASGEEEEAKAGDAIQQWAPVVFVYVLWISLLMVVMMLLTNTVMEKSNRLIEVLLSSITPIELMGGKILGIAGTGLTMVCTWMIAFIAAAYFVPALLGAPIGLDLGRIAGDPIYIGSFFVYFILGYLFYAAVLVGLGSVCDNIKDAQNLNTPVTLMLFIPILIMVPVGQDPNGTIARVCSYFPPFTPFVMMNRAAGPPPMIDYVLTTLLMVVSIAIALWVAAKIFRVGILLTGKPPKLLEILKWLRAPVGAVKK